MLRNFKKKVRSGLLPIYSSNERILSKGITNKFFREIISNLIVISNNKINENLNKRINEKYNLVTKYQALKNIHFPESQKLLSSSEFRLKYEEFFFLQLNFLLSNSYNKSRFKGFNFSKVGNSFNSFYKKNYTLN